MNTKTNFQHATNPYNGGTVGRDSPAALLDMLAEVASQTLHSEKKRIKSLLASQCKSKTAIGKRKESCFTVSQLSSMPVSHLIKQFAIFTSDELKRQYSYTCALVPECKQKYTSFASEGKARVSIKNHLIEHLEYLKTDKEAYNTFTARNINHKSLKNNSQHKKSKIQQVKKPQETLNKENKDVTLEKSTNYLRKILLNDMSFKEIEKQKNSQKKENKDIHNSELKNPDQIDIKVLGDHSYFERLDDKMPNRKGISSLNNVLDNTTREENIVLMVVGTDTVHTKEYSHVDQKLSENIKYPNSDTLYLPELSWPDETRLRNTEVSMTTKPKGKAKFIGTSKEEREMALAYMDRIKKKGNPTGSNLQCRICDPPRSFTAPTTLVSHYRSHAGIKPYECRICRAVFTRRHSLKYHMLIHQNQTRFTCADCGKKFRHPSHFREHQRRHTGEAPFGCDDCGQRFKTRNTYKRHLKTRHGKILTTTGELLHLSEEDFQKVRTNRRKKDSTLEVTINTDNTTPNTNIDFRNQYNQSQIETNTIEEYVFKENIDDINSNWETKDTIQIANKCFENIEISSESHLNKTDGIETEITLDCRYVDKDDNSIKVEYLNGVRNDLSKSKKVFYDHLQATNSEESHILYYDNNENQEKVYECSMNENQSCHEENCNNEIFKEIEEDNTTKHKTNVDFLKEQDENNLHTLQKSINDCRDIYSNEMQKNSQTYMHLKTEETETVSTNDVITTSCQIDNERYNTHVIITPDNIIHEESINYVNGFDSETNKKSVANDVTFHNADVNILQTFNEGGSEVTLPNENNVLQQNEYLHNYEQIVADCIEDPNVTSKNSNEAIYKTGQEPKKQRYLYVQNKCINVLPHQINLCYNQQNPLQGEINNYRQIKVLNKDIQAINMKQSNRQNAVLFVSSDNLKNGILQIDKNNITVNNLKK